MIRDFARVAPRLLSRAPGDGDTTHDLAARAVQACERLVHHLARLLGDTAVDMIFARSVVLASKQFSWLRAPTTHAARGPQALREALESQEPASIVSAFVAVLSEFVGILERLIGEGLVARLLNEVWPTVFVPEAKDVP